MWTLRSLLCKPSLKMWLVCPNLILKESWQAKSSEIGSKSNTVFLCIISHLTDMKVINSIINHDWYHIKAYKTLYLFCCNTAIIWIENCNEESKYTSKNTSTFFMILAKKYLLRKLCSSQHTVLLRVNIYCLKWTLKDITDTLLVAIDNSNQTLLY